jgi:hypothetical protein
MWQAPWRLVPCVVVVWAVAAGVASQSASALQQIAELRGGHFPIDARNTTDLVVGDVDRDGDVDAILGSDTTCGLFLNDGRAVFAPGLPLPASPARALALADVDRDGDLDLVLARERGVMGMRNALFRNDGGGRFTDVTATHMPGTIDVTWAVAAGDVDGDGDFDLVFGNDGANRLCLNNGAGVFTDAPAGRLPPGAVSTAVVVLGDVDGDGDLDLVLGNQRTNNELYVNNGAGVFTDVTAGRLPSFTQWTQALLLVDVDRDGDRDLLVGESGEPVRALRNDGSGRFTDVTAALMPALTLGTTDLGASDVDGDGDLDVVIASNLDGNRVFVNDGTGRFAVAARGRLPLDGYWTSALAIADLGGDARPDLVFGSTGCSAGQAQVHLNDGAGLFTAGAATALSGACGETYSVAPLTDLDGDGDLDAILGNEGPNLVLFQDGEGQFMPDFDALPLHRDTTYALATGDVDGDGDADVLAGSAGGQARLYLNDGRGRFADGTARLPVRIDGTSSVLLADVDGDRDLDAALGVRGGQLLLYANDGAGTFTDVTATRVPALLTTTVEVAAGDVDRDGDLDLVLANHLEPCRLYRNDGSGRFTDVTSTHMPGRIAPSEGLAVGDVDGDGDLDLVIANFGPAQLFVNQGTGRFVDATAGRLPATNTAAYAALAADLDADGDNDLVVGTRMFLNNGSGTFADVTARLPLFTLPSAIAGGDADRDGDVDLLLGSAPALLLTNRLRQVHTPFIARRGATFAFDFAVEPGLATADRLLVPWLSFARLTPPLLVPPFGLWGLDPALAIQLPAVTVPVLEGEARVAFMLPAAAPIQGITLFTQALVLHGSGPADWRLTGVIADRVIH